MNKIFCEKMQALMPHAMDGELDETIRAIVMRHSEDCRACAEALEFHSAMRESIQRGALTCPSAPYFEGALAEIRHQVTVDGGRVRPISLRRRAIQSGAGALAGAIGVVWLFAVYQLALGVGAVGSQSAALRPVAVQARGERATIDARGATLVALVCLLPIAGGAIVAAMRRSGRRELDASRRRRLARARPTASAEHPAWARSDEPAWMKADAGRRYARGERAPEVAGGLARIVPAVEDEPEAGSIELELAEERIEDAEAGDTIRLIELIRRRKKTDSRIELGQRRS